MSAKDAKVPVYVFEESSSSFEVTMFHTFTSGAASPNRFDVPRIQCTEE